MPADGSCYIHSIICAFFYPYITSDDPKSIVDEFRRSLSIEISREISPGIRRYDQLNRGELSKLGQDQEMIIPHVRPETFEDLPEFTLDFIVKELASNSFLSHDKYQELISDLIDKDIYLIDPKGNPVKMAVDRDLVFKNRSSIVLCYGNRHYDLVGIQVEHQLVKTLFEPTHPLILKLKSFS